MIDVGVLTKIFLDNDLEPFIYYYQNVVHADLREHELVSSKCLDDIVKVYPDYKIIIEPIIDGEYSLKFQRNYEKAKEKGS